MLEFCEDLLNGVQIRTAGREKEEPGPCIADGSADFASLVAAEIVHDHDVTRPEAWHKDLFDVAEKALAIDRAVEHARCGYCVTAQGRKECHCLPMAMGNVGHEPLSLQAPSPNGCHVGFGPCFVNEHKS